MMNRILFAIPTLVALMLVSPAIKAQAADDLVETLPLKVKFIQHKLAGTEPNYAEIASRSPILRDIKNFGRRSVFASEVFKVKKLFEETHKHSLITAYSEGFLGRVNVEDGSFAIYVPKRKRQLVFPTRDADYVVLIRNLSSFRYFRAPMRTLNNFTRFASRDISTSLTFQLVPVKYLGEQMLGSMPQRMILADIVRVDIHDFDSGEFLHTAIPLEYSPTRLDAAVNKLEDDGFF